MTVDEPRTMRPETPVTKGRLIVTAPRTRHGRQAAERVQQALKVLGAGSELLDDPEGALLTVADGPVVVVGNLSDSRCVRELYYHFLCATDLWHPGPGGCELRTLCDPFGTGHNVILIGYSDAPGAEAATDAFLSRLDDPIPYKVDIGRIYDDSVEHTRWRAVGRGTSQQVCALPRRSVETW